MLSKNTKVMPLKSIDYTELCVLYKRIMIIDTAGRLGLILTTLYFVV